MKKKIFILILLCCLLLPTAFCFGGCAKPEKYYIRVYANNLSGGTTYGSGSYEKNTKIVIAAEAYEGYEFINWSDGDTNPIRTVTVNNSMTYTANFKTTPNVQTKYAIDSIEIYLDGSITDKVERVILESLKIERADNSYIKCLDLSGYKSNYKGNDGIDLYNEHNTGYKKYTQNAPLTLYMQRCTENEFTANEYCKIYYEMFAFYDDTTSQAGAGASSFEYKEFTPTSTTFVSIFAETTHVTIAFKINFVQI